VNSFLIKMTYAVAMSLLMFKKTELFGKANCANDIRLLEEKNSNILKKQNFQLKLKWFLV